MTLAAQPPPPRGATTKDRRPRPRPSHHDRPKAIGHDDWSTLVLTTTLLFLFSGHSPPDWTRGCRVISGLPSFVGPNTPSGEGGVGPEVMSFLIGQGASEVMMRSTKEICWRCKKPDYKRNPQRTHVIPVRHGGGALTRNTYLSR